MCQSGSESELFTGGTSKDNHSPGPVIRGGTNEVNLVTASSAYSEAEIRKFIKEFQSHIVWGEETELVNISRSQWGLKCQGVMIPGKPD